MCLLIGACDKPAPPAQAAGPKAKAIEAAVQSVESYIAARRPREALQVAERLTATIPDSMRVHELHARTLVAVALDSSTAAEAQHDWWQLAADAYDRAVKLEPDNAGLLHAAGVANSSAGRHEAARDHYAAARKLDMTSAQYALYLGMAHASLNQLDDAQAMLREAQLLAPNSPDPKAALADLAVRRSDFAAARTHISQARALAPELLPLRLADARIRRLDKHPEEALDLLMALDLPVQCEPGVAEELALAHTAMGDFNAAAHALEASAGAKPDDWRRSLRCSEAWQRASDAVKAQIWMQRAMEAGAPSAASVPRPAEASSP